MKKLMFIMSCIAVAAVMTSCKDSSAKEARAELNAPFNQEREFMKDAIRHHSPDVQRVDLIGNTVVYTHILWYYKISMLKIIERKVSANEYIWKTLAKYQGKT